MKIIRIIAAAGALSLVLAIRVVEAQSPTITPTSTPTVTSGRPPCCIQTVQWPRKGVAGQLLTFSVNALPPQGATITGYHWSFGDGDAADGATVTHVYTTPGQYLVGLSVTASTGGAIATDGIISISPTTTSTDTVELFQGCNNVAVTWPDNTSAGTVADAVSPSDALIAIWRFDAAQGRFVGFSPKFPQASDFTSLNRLDAIFVCMSAPGILIRPSI